MTEEERKKGEHEEYSIGDDGSSAYNKTTAGAAALSNLNNASSALSGYGKFGYGNQSQYNDIINRIQTREPFKYDLNGDALYQQYKDKYIQQGKMAMADTIGQASAMTGGYGNSYAQSVGQQMYQKELQNLNDVVPELWQLAYDKYQAEGQDLYNQYALLSDDYKREFDEWKTGYDMLTNDYNRASDAYDKGLEEFNNAEKTYLDYEGKAGWSNG